jgi:hypothetical protein
MTDLGDALILRAWSGPFSKHSERSESTKPNLTVFDDGRVVTDVGVPGTPDYRVLTLTADELETLRETLLGLDLEPLAAGALHESAICADCATTIIQTDIEGRTVELAATGLYTEARPAYVESLPYPRSLIFLDRLLSDLAERVERDGDPYHGELPDVTVAPMVHG